MSALALTAALWLSGSPDVALEQFHPAPLYAPDRARTAMLATGWSLFGLNATVTPVVAFFDNLKIDCRSHCNSSSKAWLTMAPAIFTPSLPRWAAGDVQGALIYTSLRAASWTAGAILEKNATEASFGVFVAAFVVPLGLGLADLVTTPHREDLKAPKADGVQLQGIAPTPWIGAAGLHGGTLQATGVF